ncbi:MAG: DUF4157 domain-containing protein [bacterium]
MERTKEWRKQKNNTSTPVKNRNNKQRLSRNLCGGCSVCHQMTRNHSMNSSPMLASAVDGRQYPNLQKPCATRFFQRHLGNNLIQNIAEDRQTSGHTIVRGGELKIQRKCSCGGACTECAGKEEEVNEVQAKLRVGSVNDAYEQEADRVAGHIMRMPDSSVEADNNQSHMGINIQRISGDNGSSFETTQDIRLNQNEGRPLSSSTRKFMEPRFGIDFSHVRMHTDHNASDTASQIQVRAFTYGNHIWSGEGAKESDKRLIAHELIYRGRQTSPRIARKPRSTSSGTHSRLSQPQPHYDTIQKSFGHHSLAGLQVYAGSDARHLTDAAGTEALTLGSNVIFSRPPELHVAAHEAAHVVQQRRGVTNQNEIELHADRVATRVTNGQSAESLLDSVGSAHAAPVNQPLAYGGPMDVKSAKAAQYRKEAFETARKKVQKLLKKKKIRAKLSQILHMPVSEADMTNALTVPVVFESEVKHNLAFTDTQASSLDKKVLQEDQKRIWKIKAENAQAFFQTGEGTDVIKQPMIAVLDETIREEYQEKSGFFHNIGHIDYNVRLVHEYVHAAIHFANARRKKKMKEAQAKSHSEAWWDERVASLKKKVTSDTDRKTIREKLQAVGALGPKEISTREKKPVFLGTKEEQEEQRKGSEAAHALAKERKELRELVVGLTGFQAGHGLKETGEYGSKTSKKLEDVAPLYVGGNTRAWVDHAAMKAIGVAIAKDSDKP